MRRHNQTRQNRSFSTRVDSWKGSPEPESGQEVAEPNGRLPARSDVELDDLRTAGSMAQIVEEPKEVTGLGAAAGRIPDLEARIVAEKSRADGAERREAEARAAVLEERRERRDATAAVLRQLQAVERPDFGVRQGQVMIAAPVPEEIRGSRRFAYFMAAASCLAVAVLGWRLIAVDASLAHAGDRIHEIVSENAAVAMEAAQLAGELNATRETLRDERERTSELERLSVEAQQEARHAREAAATALGIRTLLRTASGF